MTRDDLVAVAHWCLRAKLPGSPTSAVTSGTQQPPANPFNDDGQRPVATPQGVCVKGVQRPAAPEAMAGSATGAGGWQPLVGVGGPGAGSTAPRVVDLICTADSDASTVARGGQEVAGHAAGPVRDAGRRSTVGVVRGDPPAQQGSPPPGWPADADIPDVYKELLTEVLSGQPRQLGQPSQGAAAALPDQRPRKRFMLAPSTAGALPVAAPSRSCDATILGDDPSPQPGRSHGAASQAVSSASVAADSGLVSQAGVSCVWDVYVPIECCGPDVEGQPVGCTEAEAPVVVVRHLGGDTGG